MLYRDLRNIECDDIAPSSIARPATDPSLSSFDRAGAQRLYVQVRLLAAHRSTPTRQCANAPYTYVIPHFS